MIKKCCIAVVCCLLAGSLSLQGQRQWLLHRYDETNSQLQGHPTMMLQDRSGLLWIATWNGLCRFDGYEFRQIKPQAGDGCSMSSDRLRDIWLAENGDIYCRTDDGIFRFNIKTYRFSDLSDREVEQARQQRHHQHTRGNYSDGMVSYVDQQGLEWQLSDDALCCFSRSEQPARELPISPKAMVRCMHQDSKGRIWIATREDAAVRLYDQQLNLLGYLSPNGRLQSQPVSFGAAVYSFAETADGTCWLGSKPNGLYRLRETSPASFFVDFIDNFGGYGVYDIKPDRHRDLLWIATLGGGVCCVQNCREEHPKVVSHVGNYPADACQNVRFIHLVEGEDATDYLVAATTEGLVVGKLGHELSQCVFRRHVKEPFRPTSLSCNATMDIAEDQQRHLFVSTETDGICQLLTTDLWADTLSFRNYDLLSGHLPSDMTLSVSTQSDGHLLITSQTQFILLDTRRGLSQSFGHRFFHRSYRFSETRPLTLADGRWLFATAEGAFTLEQQAARKSSYQPPLVLTGISIQGGTQDYANNARDTILLSPSERSLTIRFAALDYAAPEAVRYQFRMGNDTATWNNLGHEHAVTLLDLKPGTYQLALRSTNADGQWTQNVRTLTIICRPTFWETPWATLLLLLTGLLIAGGVAYTYLYIRGIKRKQRETLEAYLALLNNATESVSAPEEQPCVAPQMKQEDDAMMRRIMVFIEENIGNGDASVGDMAAAAATSRSGLQRKLKQTMGITPQDLLREARIKHACQLLRQTPKTVAEVAYSCGFSDPKYFSRCFKQSTGMSPTEYKSTL